MDRTNLPYYLAMSTTRLSLVLITVLCACDPRARVSEGSGSASGGASGGDGESVPGVSAPPANPSRAGESCAATPQCEAPLRCVEQICRSAETSRLGEYLWTWGEVALEKNDILGAIDA